MHKRFLKNFFLGLGTFLLLVIAVIVIFDPFYHYHGVIGNMKTVLEDRDYEVAGTLDHFDYDAVILGTSTAENYNIDQFRDNFGTVTVKAIRASGSNADMLYYLDRAYKSRNLQKVFYFLEIGSMEAPLETSFAQYDTEFIMNDNPFDDIRYVLNKDVLLKKIPLQIAYSYILPYDEGEPYAWYQSKTFSREEILKHYYPRDDFLEMKPDKDICEEFYENAALLEEKISEHPETEFFIVLSPVSILWWDNAYRNGTIRQKMYEITYLIDLLIRYENVRVFCYQDLEEYVTDLDKYMDTVHFSNQVSREICDRLAAGDGEIRPENVEERLKTLYEMVETFSRAGIREYYPECTIE